MVTKEEMMMVQKEIEKIQEEHKVLIKEDTKPFHFNSIEEYFDYYKELHLEPFDNFDKRFRNEQ